MAEAKDCGPQVSLRAAIRGMGATPSSGDQSVVCLRPRIGLPYSPGSHAIPLSKLREGSLRV